MNFIYLEFDTGGLPQAARDRFALERAPAILGEPTRAIKVEIGDRFCCAVSHSGRLRSSGIHVDSKAVTVIAGSCWHDPESSTLATPQELHEAWDNWSATDAPQLSGLFAFGRFEAGPNRLVVESDYCGAMPLYYRQEGTLLSVSSEIKFLLRSGSDRPDTEAVAEFLHLGFISRPHTLLQGIRRMPAGSRLIQDAEGIRLITLGSVDFSRDKPLDDDAIAHHDVLIRRFLGRFSSASDCFAVSMSGGLDSRLMAFAAQRAGMNCTAYTTGEGRSLDTEIARLVATDLGMPLRFHDIDPGEMPDWFGRMVWRTEGRVHPGHMHYMSANHHGAVPPGPVLHGLGLEAILGGHFDDAGLEHASAAQIRQACVQATTGLNYWPRYTREQVYSTDITRINAGLVGQISAKLFDRIGWSGTYSDYINYRFQFKGVDWAHPCIIGQVLPWSDVVGPYFDHHLHRFGGTLARSGIADRTGQIKWGQRYFPSFADHPRVKSGVLMPVSLDTPHAYKKGLSRRQLKASLLYNLGRMTAGRVAIPMRDSFPQYWLWYARFREVRDYVDSILLSDRTFDRGFVRPRGVKRLLHDCRIGRKVWNAVGTILVLELFMRQFVDGSDRPNRT